MEIATTSLTEQITAWGTLASAIIALLLGLWGVFQQVRETRWAARAQADSVLILAPFGQNDIYRLVMQNASSAPVFYCSVELSQANPIGPPDPSWTKRNAGAGDGMESLPPGESWDCKSAGPLPDATIDCLFHFVDARSVIWQQCIRLEPGGQLISAPSGWKRISQEKFRTLRDLPRSSTLGVKDN